MEFFCKIMSLVTFDQLNAFLLNECIHFFPKKKKNLTDPKYFKSRVYKHTHTRIYIALFITNIVPKAYYRVIC